MGDEEHKWYLKLSLACVRRHSPSKPLPFLVDILAHHTRKFTCLVVRTQHVREDTDAAHRYDVHERGSQFVTKFEDVALRLKVRISYLTPCALHA
jgi:hypothetical protein